MEKQIGVDWEKFGMDEAAYKQWWPLHRQAALGEPLSAEEQARYEAGLRQLEAAEQLGFDMAGLERVREQIKQAEAECQQLQQRYEAMQAEIAALEVHLDKPTKQLLKIGR